ncbi:MAG: hypothetical protein ACETVR_04070 [Candidatus Bathyarchaeia archaeon]
MSERESILDEEEEDEKKEKELITFRGVVMKLGMKKGIIVLAMLVLVLTPLTLALPFFSYIPSSVFDGNTLDYIENDDISILLTFDTETQERRQFSVILNMDKENNYSMVAYTIYFKIPAMLSKYHTTIALYSCGQLNRSDSAWVTFRIPEIESNTNGNLLVMILYREGSLKETYEVDVFNSLPISDSAYNLLQFIALGSCTALVTIAITLKLKKRRNDKG